MSDETVPVAELRGFPFGSHEDFRKAVAGGAATVDASPSMAMEWANATGYSTLLMSTMLPIPFIFLLTLVGYALWTRPWLLLAFLPVWLATFLLFKPTGSLVGGTRMVLIIVCLVALVWSAAQGSSAGLLLTGGAVVVWITQTILYGGAVKGMTQATLRDERVLSVLWDANRVWITLPNGDRYARLGQLVGGQYSDIS